MVQASREHHRIRSGQETRSTAPVVRRTPSGASGYLLFLAGIGVAAFGFGLIQPPTAIPHADWIALKFSRLGFQGVPFMAAGLTIFCFGFVLRLQARVGRALAVTDGSGHDSSQDLTRLVEELGQVRGALGNVQTELLANKQRQDSMLDSIQAVTAKSKNSEGDSNAMFRLAASLDQLGARIEERLKQQGQSFENRLADVNMAVVRAQQEVTEAVDHVETSVTRVANEVEVVKHQKVELTNHFATQAQAMPSPQPEVSEEYPGDDFGFEEPTQPESSEEDLHVYVELEEEAPVQPQPEPTLPQQESKLGILDSLDDYGGIVEQPSAQEEGLRMAGEPDSALPGQQAPQPFKPQPQPPQQQSWPPTPQGE